jgi:hypothetical protein
MTEICAVYKILDLNAETIDISSFEDMTSASRVWTRTCLLVNPIVENEKLQLSAALILSMASDRVADSP